MTESTTSSIATSSSTTTATGTSNTNTTSMRHPPLWESTTLADISIDDDEEEEHSSKKKNNKKKMYMTMLPKHNHHSSASAYTTLPFRRQLFLCAFCLVFSLLMAWVLLLLFYGTNGLEGLFGTGTGGLLSLNSSAGIKPSFSMHEPKKLKTLHYTPPVYFSIATLSLGGDQIQQKALDSFASRLVPDFFVLQDAPTKKELDNLDSVLLDHDRIHYSTTTSDTTQKNQSLFQQWETNTIFYNRKMWRLVEHGTNRFGQFENKKNSRFLFWARFEIQLTQQTVNKNTTTKIKESILIASVSLTPAGSQQEINTAKNIRIRECDAIVDILRKVEQNPEAMIIVGDMGDGFSARNLFEPVGLMDPFSLLHLQMEPTFPAMGMMMMSTSSPTTRDWIFSNDRVRPLSASVVHFVSPMDIISSHYPVLGIYELIPCGHNCPSLD